MATKRNSRSTMQSMHHLMWQNSFLLHTLWGMERDGENISQGALERCVAHQKEANRTHQVCYKPKWSNVLTSGSGIENEGDKLCAYPSCTNSQVIAPSFASLSEIIFFCKFNKNQYHQLFYVQCIIKNCINK